MSAGALLLALAGCGSATKTVTVNGPPAGTTTGAGRTDTTKSTAAAPTTTSTSGPSTSSTATHTAPEPQFTEAEAKGEQTESEGLTAAEAVVKGKGFTPNDPSEYKADQTLRVLTATRTGSGDGYGQRAFFFLDGRYIGTDTKEPSATVAVVSQSDTEVALAYPLYRPNDPLCCAGAGKAIVHFQLNNGRLTPLEPIPPASSKTRPSRL